MFYESNFYEHAVMLERAVELVAPYKNIQSYPTAELGERFPDTSPDDYGFSEKTIALMHLYILDKILGDILPTPSNIQSLACRPSTLTL